MKKLAPDSIRQTAGLGGWRTRFFLWACSALMFFPPGDAPCCTDDSVLTGGQLGRLGRRMAHGIHLRHEHRVQTCVPINRCQQRVKLLCCRGWGWISCPSPCSWGRGGLCTMVLWPVPPFSLLNFILFMVCPPVEWQDDWESGGNMQNVNSLYFRGFIF